MFIRDGGGDGLDDTKGNLGVFLFLASAVTFLRY